MRDRREAAGVRWSGFRFNGQSPARRRTVQRLDELQPQLLFGRLFRVDALILRIGEKSGPRYPVSPLSRLDQVSAGLILVLYWLQCNAMDHSVPRASWRLMYAYFRISG